MMRRLVLVILCLLIPGASHCYGSQQILYITPASSSTTLEAYANKNTTVKWKVLDKNDRFQVKFVGIAPCKSTNYPDPLTAYTKHPAECKIRIPKGYPKDTVLRFKYQIIHTPKRDDDQQIFFQHVGSCDPCTDSGSPIGATVANAVAASTPASPPTYLPTTYMEDLSCTLPYISPDPTLPVYVGDTIYWENPNGAGHPSWTIEFKPAACKVAPTFKNPTCEVTASPSATYTYKVVIGNGISPGCTFSGSITVSAPPAR